jgi:hypothetical protein
MKEPCPLFSKILKNDKCNIIVFYCYLRRTWLLTLVDEHNLQEDGVYIHILRTRV